MPPYSSLQSNNQRNISNKSGQSGLASPLLNGARSQPSQKKFKNNVKSGDTEGEHIEYYNEVEYSDNQMDYQKDLNQIEMTDEAEIDINIINQINYDSLSKSIKSFSNFDIGNNMKNSLSNSQIQFQINPEINLTEENEVRI